MKVTVDGEVYLIRWRYKTVPVLRGGKEIGTTIQTECIARTNDADIEIGSVKKYHLDVEDREEARKRSLEALLSKLFPIKKATEYEEYDSILSLGLELKEINERVDAIKARAKIDNAPNKALRSKFWDAYYSRKGDINGVDLKEGLLLLIELYGEQSLKEALDEVTNVF